VLRSDGDTGRRRRMRRHGSRGTASVEYGLLIALIGAALCLGVGVAVKTMFNDTVTCMLGNLPGQTPPSWCGGSGSGGAGGGGGGGGGVVPDPEPTPDPTPCPTEPPGPDDPPLPDGCPEPTPAPT
jgi:Flp pilus assembly pilin Flp